MRKWLPVLVMSGCLSAPVAAQAGFDRWTAEIKDDPFTNGRTVLVDYMSSIRSGIFISCNTADTGIRIRAVPGYAYNPDIEGFEPFVEFAFDGKRMSGIRGKTTSVGDNLAAVDAFLQDAAAAEFVAAFSNAARQVAIQDGMSDKPHLLRAAGSTAAGRKLADCYREQKN